MLTWESRTSYNSDSLGSADFRIWRPPTVLRQISEQPLSQDKAQFRERTLLFRLPTKLK